MKILHISHGSRILFLTLVILAFILNGAAQPSAQPPAAKPSAQPPAAQPSAQPPAAQPSAQLSAPQSSAAQLSEPSAAQPPAHLFASDSLPDSQLQELRGTVTHEVKSFQRWWNVWLAGYSAATVAQGVVSITSEDKTLRQDMVLGAATTLLGAAGQIISPMVDYDSELRKSLADLKTDSLQSLSGVQYEELLKALAYREKEGRSWKTHATACAVNLGSGLITWLGFKRTFKDGLQNFALNTVVTELQIWTQPIRAVKAYERYSALGGDEQSTNPPGTYSEWNMSVYPGGFTFSLTF